MNNSVLLVTRTACPSIATHAGRHSANHPRGVYTYSGHACVRSNRAQEEWQRYVADKRVVQSLCHDVDSRTFVPSGMLMVSKFIDNCEDITPWIE
jgi:hypothetical protein